MSIPASILNSTHHQLGISANPSLQQAMHFHIAGIDIIGSFVGYNQLLSFLSPML
jgi:hypothetical protein